MFKSLSIPVIGHKQFKKISQVISLLIIASLSFNTLTWAFDLPGTQGTVLHQQAIKHLGKTVTIPEKYGSIAHTFQGKGQTIVCIQDLHCHYEVQKNIAAIISHLNQRHQLKLIGEEGGIGTLNMDVVRDFPLHDSREAVTNYYVKEGQLTGAEYFFANHDQEAFLEGVESEKLYRESYEAIQSFLNAESQGYCFDLRDSLEEIKSYLYNPPLYHYDQKRVAYRNGELELVRYAVFLKKSAKSFHLDLTDYPHFQQFVGLQQKNSSSLVDAAQLQLDIDQIDAKIRRQLYSDPVQEELDRLIGRLDIIEKLLNISVTPDELEQFRDNRAAYQVKAFVDFIKKYDQTAMHYFDGELFSLDEKLKKVETFYRLADERSVVFVEKMLASMQAKHESISLMVNGGFHIEKIMEELKRRQISFVSVKPNVTRQDIVNPYFNLLQGQKSPLERLLAKNQTIYAPEVLPMRPAELQTAAESAFDPIALLRMKSLSGDAQDQVSDYIQKHQIVGLEPLLEIRTAAGQPVRLPQGTAAFTATIVRAGTQVQMPLVITSNQVNLQQQLDPASAYRSIGKYQIALLDQGADVAQVVRATASGPSLLARIGAQLRMINLSAAARALWDFLNQPMTALTLNYSSIGRMAMITASLVAVGMLAGTGTIGSSEALLSSVVGLGILSTTTVGSDRTLRPFSEIPAEEKVRLEEMVQAKDWSRYRAELEEHLIVINNNERGRASAAEHSDQLIQFLSDMGATIRKVFPHDRIEPYYPFQHAVVRLRFSEDGPALHDKLLEVIEKNFDRFPNQTLALKVLLQYGKIPAGWFKQLTHLQGRPLDLFTAEIFPTGGGLSHVIKTIMDGFENLMATKVDFNQPIDDPSDPFGSQQTVWTVYYPNKVKTDGGLEANKLDQLGLKGIDQANKQWVDAPQKVDEFVITMPNDSKQYKVEVLEGYVAEKGTRVRFIKQPEFLPVLYAYQSEHNPNGELESNFFLYKAMRQAVERRNQALQAKLGDGYRAPISIGNDGQTGLIGAYPGYEVALTAYVSHTFWNRQFMNYDLEKFKLYCQDAGIPEHIAAQAIYNNDRADFSGFGLSATMDDTPTASTYVSQNQRNFNRHQAKMDSIRDTEVIVSSIGNGDDLAVTYQPIKDAYQRLIMIKKWLDQALAPEAGHETIDDLNKAEYNGYYLTLEMKFLEYQAVKQIGFEWQTWLPELKNLSEQALDQALTRKIRGFKVNNHIQNADMQAVAEKFKKMIRIMQTYQADQAPHGNDLSAFNADEQQLLKQAAQAGNELQGLAVLTQHMAQNFYYSLNVSYRTQALTARQASIQTVLDRFIKDQGIDLTKPESLSWQEVALLSDYGRFAFAEELDQEGIKRIGFELEKKLNNARHFLMQPGWANTLEGGLANFIEDDDLRRQLSKKVDEFLQNRIANEGIDPNNQEELSMVARQAAEYFCDTLSYSQRTKLLKPLGYFIDPLKPYSVYPGRLVDEKFGSEVIAQLPRMARAGYQFVALAREQKSHPDLARQLEGVVREVQQASGAVAFVSAYTPTLKMLAFLGAASGATPSLWGTGTSEIMEAKGPMALNVTYGSKNQAYGYLGDRQEESPVYDSDGEGSLGEAYAEKARLNPQTGEIEFQDGRDFDVVLSPGGEENPAGFIDTVIAVQRLYAYDLSQNYDATIDQLKLMQPVIRHIAGEAVGSAWITAAESLMYYNEKIAAYEQAIGSIASLVTGFADKLNKKFTSARDKLEGIGSILNQGSREVRGAGNYAFNVKQVAGFATPNAVMPASNGLRDFLGLIRAITYGGRYGEQDFPGQINALFEHLNYGGFRQRIGQIIGQDLFGEIAVWLQALEADNLVLGQREKFDLFMNLMQQVEQVLDEHYQAAIAAEYPIAASPIAARIADYRQQLQRNPNKSTIINHILDGVTIASPYQLNGFSSKSNGLIGFNDMLKDIRSQLISSPSDGLNELLVPHFNEGWFFDYLTALSGNDAFRLLMNELKAQVNQSELSLLDKIDKLISTSDLLIDTLNQLRETEGPGQPTTGTIPGLQAMIAPLLAKLGITNRSYVTMVVPLLEIAPLIAYTLYGLVTGDWLGSYLPLIVFGAFTAPRLGVFQLAHYWRGSSKLTEQAFAGRLATAEHLSVINSIIFILTATVVSALSLSPAYMAVVLTLSWWATHTVDTVMATSQPRDGEAGKIISLRALLGEGTVGEAYFNSHVIGEALYQAGQLIFGTQDGNAILKNNIQIQLGDRFEAIGHEAITATDVLAELQADDVGFKIMLPYGYRMLLEKRPGSFVGGLRYAYQSWRAGLIISRQLRVYANETKAMARERASLDQEQALEFGAEQLLRLPATLLRDIGQRLGIGMLQSKQETAIGVSATKVSALVEHYRRLAGAQGLDQLIAPTLATLDRRGYTASINRLVEALEAVDLAAISDQVAQAQIRAMQQSLAQAKAEQDEPALEIAMHQAAEVLIASGQWGTAATSVPVTGDNNFVLTMEPSTRLDLVEAIELLLRNDQLNRAQRIDLTFLRRVMQRGTISSDESAKMAQLLAAITLPENGMVTTTLGETLEGSVSAAIMNDQGRVIEQTIGGQQVATYIPAMANVVAPNQEVMATISEQANTEQVVVMPFVGRERTLSTARGNIARDLSALNQSAALSQAMADTKSPLAQAYYAWHANKKDERAQRRLARAVMMVLKAEARAMGSNEAAKNAFRVSMDQANELFQSQAIFNQQPYVLGAIGEKELFIPQAVSYGGRLGLVYLARQYSEAFVLNSELENMIRQQRLRHFRIDSAA